MGMERILLLVGVTLPPRALDVLGPVGEEFGVETPYGPAGPFARRDATLLLPYSGLPDRTDPRATLWAAKDLGVTRVVGWDAVVGINPLLTAGGLVIPDDFIDWTRRQPTTYFERRGLGYLPQSPAFCPQCRAVFGQYLPQAAPLGTYLGFDGPRRETRAETRMFRAWGVDVLGCNLVPEVILARELELCFTGLSTVVEPTGERPVGEGAADRGDWRVGLQQVLEALPTALAALAADRTCTCAQSQAGPRERGALGADWKAWF